ncbi:hypothetical protein CDAR_18331 [Caerostris darwini]|uniref:Uncharacterized protein n=1 Tax=Caerostris darwini TaxID=1538125 RepID=A0AAV4VA63_9ARAC|nr:hypothetical protein CDAR_18331 [Caerostris darwini]
MQREERERAIMGEAQKRERAREKVKSPPKPFASLFFGYPGIIRLEATERTPEPLFVWLLLCFYAALPSYLIRMVGVVEGWREKVFKVFSLKGFRFAIVLKCCCCCSCCSLSLALLQKTVCQFLVSVMRETFCSVWLVFAGCFEKRRGSSLPYFWCRFCLCTACTHWEWGWGWGEDGSLLYDEGA